MAIIFLYFLKNTFGSHFVKISTTWSWLATWTNSTIPFFTRSRIKWKRTSMCLLLSSFTGFFANSIVGLLSTCITVAPSCFRSILLNKFLSHIPWHTYQDVATYSASHVDSVTISCFFESQENVVLPLKNTYPDVFFQLSMSPYQSLSEYLTNL